VDCLQCHGRGSEKQEELRPYTRRLRTNDSFAGITRLMPIARADKMVMQEGCLINTYASMEQAHLRSSRTVEL
jgi:hypothetical protein